MSTTPTEYSDRLDRDTRLRILTMREVGYSYQQIVDHLKTITYGQFQYIY
jgi:transcriptional regulator